MSEALSPELVARLAQLKAAARRLRSSTREARDAILLSAADRLLAGKNDVLRANAADLAALPAEATPAFRDRLKLDEARLAHAALSLRQVAGLDDPLGEEVERRALANGLTVRRVRSPLGVILMIFESRPNVALESFSLALKSGNVICLRGGKESMRTTGVLYELMEAGRDYFWGITDPDRALVETLLQAKEHIDVVVPRGGDQLIDFVERTSRIPIIKNDRGLCHVYVHEDADPQMALALVANAKTQRPGVCNAMETVLVHRSLKGTFLPRLHETLEASGVEWFADDETREALRGKVRVTATGAKSYDTEYLDLKMNCRIVGTLDEAIAHIEAHGSRHSEAIVTRSETAARRFQAEVDAAVVYWNASTRFTDGFELGLGGELGISTQKLHVRGPVGLRELTSVRWIIDGTGQIRA